MTILNHLIGKDLVPKNKNTSHIDFLPTSIFLLLSSEQGWAKCSKTQRLGRFKSKDSLKIYLANKDMLIFN